MRKRLIYILDGHTPVPCDDIMKWVELFEGDGRTVGRTELPNGVLVSTVFLGLDNSFGDEEPVLFGTMIFGGEHDDYQERYHTWEEAEEGHQRAIDLIYKA